MRDAAQGTRRDDPLPSARNRNHKLQTSKAPLKSQAQGTSLFTSAPSNQRGFPKNSPWEAQTRFPEGERMRQISLNRRPSPPRDDTNPALCTIPSTCRAFQGAVSKRRRLSVALRSLWPTYLTLPTSMGHLDLVRRVPIGYQLRLQLRLLVNS